MRLRGLPVLSVALLLVGNVVPAQWITFDDATAQRLRLSPMVDGTIGPAFDDAEKDIAVGDLNRDGWTDIVVVRKVPFSNPGALQDLLLINRRGRLMDMTERFAPGFQETLTDARDVFIGDFTGDEWPDVMIANTFGQQPRFYRNRGNNAMGRWLGLADETDLRLPVLQVPVDVNVVQFCAVWGGDITGNGALDIYLSNYREFGGTNDILLINDGNGFFTNETDARLGILANVAFGTSAEIHDVDNDGDNDIVKISTLYEAAPFDIGQFILFNDGSGVFDQIPFQTLDSDAPYMFTVADFNGDGMLDQFLQGDEQDRLIRATAVSPGQVEYRMQRLQSSPRTRDLGGNTKAADLDGDGDLDVGVAPIDVDVANCGFSEDFALLQNRGDGFLSDAWTSSEDQNFHLDPHDFAFLDLNDDGCLDLFMGLCTGWKVFVQNNCPAP